MTKVYTGLRVTKKGEEGDRSIFPVCFVSSFAAYGQSFKSEGLSFLPTGKNVSRLVYITSEGWTI